MLAAVLPYPKHQAGLSPVGGAGHPSAHGEPLAAVIAKLLDDARQAVGKDDLVARTCIVRASALLRAEQDRTELNSHEGLKQPARGGLAPWQIRRVMRHIDEHLDSSIRMDDFADITRLSASYFSRAFKGSFGVSPHAYIVQRRVERAKEMMLTTDEPLCHIALACGLCDQAHFSKLFRRVVGASPNSWRRQRRGEPAINLAHQEI